MVMVNPSKAKFNAKSQKPVRQRLRNEMTRSEKMLWYYLRGSGLDGYKFRRQQGVGQYIVDFYCPRVKIAVELDGDSHFRSGAALHDRVRQNFIEAQGIRVLRFTDNDVRDSLPDVVALITRELRTTPNPSSERRGIISPFSSVE